MGPVLLHADAVEFSHAFDLDAFSFAHELVAHPLFTFESLRENLAAFERAGLVSYAAGDAEIGGGWAGQARKERKAATAAEALEHIATSGAWLKIRALDHPAYAHIFEEIINEVSSLCGRDLRRSITRANATLFVSSPGSVTPYHLDHETNFLFQIRGRKTYSLFDGRDPRIVSSEDIEGYYISGALNFREEVQQYARVFNLVPGVAIHQPSGWPHWVRTESEPSVSLSINFCLRERDLVARVHQCNHYLRRLGMQPAAPGDSTLSDSLKQIFLASWRRRPARSLDEHLRGSLRRIEAPIKAVRRVSGRFSARAG